MIDILTSTPYLIGVYITLGIFLLASWVIGGALLVEALTETGDTDVTLAIAAAIIFFGILGGVVMAILWPLFWIPASIVIAVAFRVEYNKRKEEFLEKLRGNA